MINLMIRLIRNIIIVTSFLIVMFSCSNHELKPVSYVLWVEDQKNGLYVEKEIGELVFSVQYKPIDYIILQQSQKPIIDSNDYNKIKQDIEGLLYFNFSISNTDNSKSPLYYKINSKEEFQYRLSYFSFEISNDIHLVYNNDTFPCALHHFERTYDLIPEVNIVLGFEKPENFIENEIDQDLQFVYSDKIFGVGKTQLIIDKKHIKKIPKLKISTYAAEN